MDEFLRWLVPILLTKVAPAAFLFGLLIAILAWLIKERDKEEDDEFERWAAQAHDALAPFESFAQAEQHRRMTETLEGHIPQGSGRVSGYSHDAILLDETRDLALGRWPLPPLPPHTGPHILTYMGRQYRPVDEEAPNQPWECSWCGTQHADKLTSCSKCGHAYDPVRKLAPLHDMLRRAIGSGLVGAQEARDILQPGPMPGEGTDK